MNLLFCTSRHCDTMSQKLKSITKAQLQTPFMKTFTCPCFSIIQSSGSSKTRLMGELKTKGMYVLYICKRADRSTGYLPITIFKNLV